MGIAINYDFAFEGSKDELLQKITVVRTEIMKLNVQCVDEVAEIPPAVPSAENVKDNPFYSYLLLSMQSYSPPDGAPNVGAGPFNEEMAHEANGVGFHVVVSDGCEPFSVFLGMIGKSQSWFGGGSTKTMGGEDFIEAHLAVIKMLKICQDAGILQSVDDEAEMWENIDTDIGFDFM
jgi:hypothetical protein